MKKRLLAGFMACALVLSLLPTAAFAADGVVVGAFTVSGGEKDTDYTYENNTLTIKTSTPLTISGTTTTDKIVIQDGVTANVTLDGVNIQFNDGGGSNYGTCAFEVAGNAICNLTLTGANTLKGGYRKAGLQVQGTATLTITESSTGSLDATGGNGGAGIGGSGGSSSGTIIINGGTVNATGGWSAAGIGGGSGGAGGTITINGGAVVAIATCSDHFATGGGAGIGGGYNSSGGTVTINGGTIKATGNAHSMTGSRGADIGAGCYSSDGTITVDGATLNNIITKGNSFTMTSGTLDHCTVENSSVSVNGAQIQNSSILNNLSSWTDANNTVSDSTLNFSSAVTLTKGGSGNTYNGTVTIADNAEFKGNTTFSSTVTISGDSASFSDSTTFKDAVTISGNNASFSGSTTFSSTVDITGNTALGGNTTLTKNVTISAGGSLTNSGTLTVPSDCTITNHATIINNNGAVINLTGVIDNKTGAVGTVTNNGTIFLIGTTGKVIDMDSVSPNLPVSGGATPIPAGEIVIDLSTVTSTVTIGPKEYTIDGTSHAYDPARNNIVLTGTYGGTISGTNTDHAAAVTIEENTTVSITLRNVNIGWDSGNYCSSIWVKDYSTVTVFLEGNSTLKPRGSGSGIRTEKDSKLTVEGTGTLNLDLSNSSYIRGIGNYSYNNENFGSITINGGNIVTTVGTSHEWVAGIGGTHGTITVNGGTIMGGKFLNGMNLIPGADYEVVINGGTINIVDNTTDTYNASGHVGHGSLTINGGVVSMPWLSTYGKDGSITINGGQVTTTHSNGYLSYTAVINGGIVTGKISVDGNNKVKINGGSAKLTQYVYNSEGETIASVSNSDGKTAYRTVLTGQGSVADLLVDGKSQNISYNHPDDPAGTADNNLYLYLVHDENAATPETHTVVVMYQDGTRKEYTATWSGDPTNAFTFGDGQDSTPTTSKDIGMTMTGTTTNQETGKPEKTYGDAKPVVVTVNLTTGQTNNALPPSNGPMLAANSLPYAFKTVILLCTDKNNVTREIERKDVPENQTSVVFYVQTQAWAPGEYKFTATYGGDATTGSSAIAETSAPALNIVGQKLDKNALTVNVAVSGTYGQKVSELAVSGTVTQSGLEIPGTWAISGVNGDTVLDVGTAQTLTATFTPSGKGYDDTLTRTITPTIGKKELTATISGTTSKTYDGNTTATGLSIALADVVSGDTVSATATITYDNANVGDNKTITASGITLTGTDANNYKLASNTATTTGSITKATIGGTLNITGTATYGQTLTASYTPTNSEAVSYQWKRGGSDISGATGNTYTLGTDDVGQTITVTVTPTDTTNYTGSVTSSATATVSTATPTVNVSVSMSGDAGSREAALTITVTGVTGGAAPTGTVTLTGDSNSLSPALALSNGTASYTWTGLTDGEHKIKATYNGDGNYGTADSAETTFNTSKQGQSITISPVGNKTYGDPAFTLSVSGGSGNGAVTFESSDPTVISISGATATIHKAGGPVTITAKKAEDTTYNEATATLNITVAKKAVVFKANDKTVQQGGTMPTFDYAAVTLAQGDTITTEPTATCTAANTNTVGTFTITFSGAVLSSPDNYEVSYQPGTLTITAKPSTGGGGGGGGYTPPTYKPDITKPSGGGDTPGVTPSNPKPGDTVTVTPKPDDGHEVGGITVTDKNGKPVEVTKKPDGTYTFKQPNGKVTIEVTYRPIDRPWNNPFSDVSESDWFYEAVKFVHQRGLMNGYSDGRFGPNDNLSRAQLAQILFNKEGRPGVNYLLTFSDVAGEAWYTEAIRWATSQGIVGGYGNGMFGPNDPITREQLAVMLWRYSGSPAATDKELHFADADEISGFALEAMRWAVENGVLNGYGDGRLGPKGQATRAQVAQMLKNFIEKQEEENT